jgi:enolase-phosphatase E1
MPLHEFPVPVAVTFISSRASWPATTTTRQGTAFLSMAEPLTCEVRGILLDIEGTTSSIRFVYEVMFPFVRRELETFLARHWRDPQVATALEQMAVDAGFSSLDGWLQADSEGDKRNGHETTPPLTPETAASSESGAALSLTTSQRKVVRETIRLMDHDVKATGLKLLQGVIWEGGFRSGELKAHLYDDVPETLRRWREQGFDVRIYSSGSIAAQRLFFGHTTAGDLLPLLNGHYDTTTGPKREESSYRRIAEAMQFPPRTFCFSAISWRNSTRPARQDFRPPSVADRETRIQELTLTLNYAVSRNLPAGFRVLPEILARLTGQTGLGRPQR